MNYFGNQVSVNDSHRHTEISLKVNDDSGMILTEYSGEFWLEIAFWEGC